MTPPSPRSTLFPYTTLFRSRGRNVAARARAGAPCPSWDAGRRSRKGSSLVVLLLGTWAIFKSYQSFIRDRKSTRLNSSHTVISYAVLCLKKKKEITHRTQIE